MTPFSGYEDPSGSNVALILGLTVGILCLAVMIVVSAIFANRFLKTKGKVTDEANHDGTAGIQNKAGKTRKSGRVNDAYNV